MVTIQRCAYAGIANLYTRTYTTTYPSLSGGNWGWNGNSPYPMEWAGYLDPASRVPLAFSAQLIDYLTGYSRLDCGNITDTLYDSFNDFPPFTYDAQISQIKGWPINGTIFPLLCSQYLAWNGAHNVNNQSGFFGAGFNLAPQRANTQMPNPGAGANALTYNRGVYCSGEILLTSGIYVWEKPPFGGISHAFNDDIGLLFPTSGRFQNSQGVISRPSLSSPSGATNIITVGSGLGGDLDYNFINTDYSSYAVNTLIDADSIPGSNIDFKTYLISTRQQQWSLTYNGWLQFIGDNLVINGQDFGAGFGILMSPDFTSYTLLNVIGQDTLSKGIFTAGGNGSTSAKMDRSGKIWMKTANVGNVLYIGDYIPTGIGPQTIHNISQIPPVNLPQNPGLYR